MLDLTQTRFHYQPTHLLYLFLNKHILVILVFFISMQYSNMHLVSQSVVTSELTVQGYMDLFEMKNSTSMSVTLLRAGGALALSHTVSINQMDMTTQNPHHTFPLLQFTERTPRQVAMI